MSQLKIGMVGMGFISDWHHQGFKTCADAEIAGMCHVFFGNEQQKATERKALKDKCAEINIKAYESFEAMVNDSEIDALIIGSINPYHYDQIKAALNNDKHVMVEKPVVTSIEEIDELEKLSQEKGKLIFPAHNFVYRDAVQKAKEKIESGKLGKVVYASFMSSHTISDDHANGWRANLEISKGGALMDSGHHLVYQSIYLMGMPKKIQAFKSNLVLNQMEGEDIAQVNLLYPDGSIGAIMQSWTSGHGADIDGLKIVGTEGSVAVTEVDYPATFQAQAKAFVDAVQNGTDPVSNLQDAKKTLKLIQSAYESAEKDCVVEL